MSIKVKRIDLALEKKKHGRKKKGEGQLRTI